MATQILKTYFYVSKSLEKIIADYGNKNYSTIYQNNKIQIKNNKYFYVSKNCFFPKPKVDSIVIEFKPYVNENLNLKSINIA